MAKRIDHGVVSATTTTGWEVAKGGILTPIAVGVVGALVGAGLAAGIAALAGAAAATVVGWAVGTSVVTGGLSFLGLGPLAAVVGAVRGGFKGVHRVKEEKTAYNERQQILSGAHVNQQQAMVQQAYAMGAQAGQQSVVQELQRVREQMIQNQMMEEAAKNPVKGPHTAKIVQDRNMGQTTQAQVG